MKKTFILIAASVLMLASCSRGVHLTRFSRPLFSIATGHNPDSNTIAAAKQLQDYIRKISGAELPVVQMASGDKKYMLIGKGSLNDSASLNRIKRLKTGGFLIDIGKDRIILAGNSGQSDLFAVSTFLEEFLGCMKFTGSEEYIPHHNSVTLNASLKIYEPAFAFRHAHFPDRQNSSYLNWHKLNSFGEWGLFVHTFQKLVPADKYFDKHPEYFSLVNGKRIRDGQLCLSNPDVIRLLGDNLGELIAAQPEKLYWSVSQNDCINYCECDNCKKLYAKYKNISGAYIEMANTLAGRFPDKQILTLAYQFTRQAPENIRPKDNVGIMLCSIECNRSMPMNDDPRNSGFVNDMKAWERLSENIFVWDYVVQFKTYLSPFPNFHILKPNIIFFRDHNARMMFQQGSGNSWSDLSELKQYLIAKLLWNPDLNADSVKSRFIDLYYGPAAGFVRQYQDLCEAEMIKDEKVAGLDIYGLPSFYFKTFLTGKLTAEYEREMNQAEMACGVDSVYLKRILKARCAPDFAYLDYALNAGDTTISFFHERAGRKVANDNMISLLKKFKENCRLTGITNIGEEKMTVSEYCSHIDTIIRLQLIKNKAAGKKIRSLTKFNPRYSAPGVSALTDGIFGGRHFNSGWLGYEGEDMVVEIDLGREDSIHRVSMNFLRDFVSWIFLPEKVRTEVSMDGINFRPVAEITNVLSDRRFGVEPVFHSMDFSPAKTRFVRISALSMKKCPVWHRGSGQPCWVFCDEIIIE